MNDFEQQALAVLCQQYPYLTEVTGSFTFDCSYQSLAGEACIEIPFGEWQWHLQDQKPGKETNPDWLSWFKYHVFEDLERYLAFRVRQYHEAKEGDHVTQTRASPGALPRGGRLDFVYGKLSLQWFYA